MKDFAAIDFETANGRRSSVCSVGIVIVRGGQVVDKFYSLIRPYPNYYTEWTTEIHGLTRLDTDYADHFPEVWAQIKDKLEGLPLVAHNARFDEGCLRAVFDAYGMEYPGYKFYCTLTASRRCLRLPNYKLHTVSAACGFDLEHHHHALADAEACSYVCLNICRKFGEELMFNQVPIHQLSIWKQIYPNYERFLSFVRNNKNNPKIESIILNNLEIFKNGQIVDAVKYLNEIIVSIPSIYLQEKYKETLSLIDFMNNDVKNINKILNLIFEIYTEEYKNI